MIGELKNFNDKKLQDLLEFLTVAEKITTIDKLIASCNLLPNGVKLRKVLSGLKVEIADKLIEYYTNYMEKIDKKEENEEKQDMKNKLENIINDINSIKPEPLSVHPNNEKQKNDINDKINKIKKANKVKKNQK
jgi:hypothetical protein